MGAPEPMPLRYRLIRGVFRFLLRLLSRLHVEGLENLPPHGPLILVTNHLHFLDAPVVFAVMPLRSYVLAAEKWETRPIMSWLFKAVDAVFVHRGEADIDALRKVEALLKRGSVVGIAPEGTRSKTGGLQQGKGGAALVASRTGATLIPVVVYGQEKVFTELRRLRRADMYLVIGEPFQVAPPAATNRSRQLDEMTLDIMLRIARLLPPEYRGVYRSYVSEEEPPAA